MALVPVPKGDPLMVEQSTAPSCNVHAIFAMADVDDITFNPEADDSERVEIVITERTTGDTFTCAGEDIEEALRITRVALDDRRKFRELREIGLSGSDVAELTNRYGLDLEAGIVTNLQTDNFRQLDLGIDLDEIERLYDLDDEFDRSHEGDSWRRGYKAGVLETGELYAAALASRLSSLPESASVGEPIEGGVVDALRIIPIDGAFLALVMPTRIATD